MDELLKLLKENALESAENLGKMLKMKPDEVRAKISQYEKEGIIRGYQAIVDEDRLGLGAITAVIEVKVTPEREGGFDRVAKRIAAFPEVTALYLMSGSFDLLLFVAGRDLKWVGSFVSEKLATMEGVTGTATHFMLKTYKSHGVLMEKQDGEERLQVTP